MGSNPTTGILQDVVCHVSSFLKALAENASATFLLLNKNSLQTPGRGIGFVKIKNLKKIKKSAWQMQEQMIYSLL